MDNDWDLYAVVKGCTATASTSTTTTTTPVDNSNMSPSDDPFLSSGSMSTFLDDDDDESFNFPSLVEDRPDGAFQGLEEFCKEFCIDPALAAAASGITATTSTLPVGQVFPSQHQIQPTQEIPQMQPQHVNLPTENPFIGSSINFGTTNPQTIRQRRRYHFLAFLMSSSKYTSHVCVYVSKYKDKPTCFIQEKSADENGSKNDTRGTLC